MGAITAGSSMPRPSIEEGQSTLSFWSIPVLMSTTQPPPRPLVPCVVRLLPECFRGSTDTERKMQRDHRSHGIEKLESQFLNFRKIKIKDQNEIENGRL